MHLLLSKSSQMPFPLSKISQFNDGEGEKGDVFVRLSNYFAITEEKHPACLGMKSTVGFETVS